MSMSNTRVALAVHGGAGTIDREQMTAEREKAYRDALGWALRRGHAVLDQGGAALDAVEAAVRALEDTPLFNAGRGSVFNADGQHEMDASIMSGVDLRAGAVAGVNNVKNPVGLARLVMDKSGHVLIDRDDHVWGIDHGLCFAADFKLRTVVWDFAGDAVEPDLLDAVGRIARQVPLRMAALLADDEVIAVQERAQWVLDHPVLPADATGRRYPWPLV